MLKWAFILPGAALPSEMVKQENDPSLLPAELLSCTFLMLLLPSLFFPSPLCFLVCYWPSKVVSLPSAFYLCISCISSSLTVISIVGELHSRAPWAPRDQRRQPSADTSNKAAFPNIPRSSAFRGDVCRGLHRFLLFPTNTVGCNWVMFQNHWIVSFWGWKSQSEDISVAANIPRSLSVDAVTLQGNHDNSHHHHTTASHQSCETRTLKSKLTTQACGTDLT